MAEAKQEPFLTCRYHPVKAPYGENFMSDKAPKGNGWVDTPAKFKKDK